MTATRYTAKLIEERRQEGGCNGLGGRTRKVQVAWTVKGARKVRYFGARPTDLEAAQKWADTLNERDGL
jgi:hypothetical protein